MAKATPPGPRKTFGKRAPMSSRMAFAMGFARPSTAAQHTAGTLVAIAIQPPRLNKSICFLATFLASFGNPEL